MKTIPTNILINIHAVKVYNNSKVVRYSKNLRAILDNHRIRHTKVVTVSYMRRPVVINKPTLLVKWANNDWAVARFSDYNVMVKWIKTRKIFKDAEIYECDAQN